MNQPFVQEAPRLGNTYEGDWLLRSHLRRVLPPELFAAGDAQLRQLGEIAGGRLRELQCADRGREPAFVPWDAWGERIDRIEPTPLWREAESLAVRLGLTAIPYERREGRWSRTRQFALVHLFHPVTDVYTCPLAMTDGAVRTLHEARNADLLARAAGHLTSRDPAQFWTSGQWMTETTGGSDVGTARTLACRDATGVWRLHGRKWFTSAAASQVALALARPEGSGDGGSGLALYYLETRDAEGRPNGFRVERLKDKLGTRKLPTAELTLDGTVARLVAGASHGTRAIAPMLAITRTWNAVCAAASMRHALALAHDYARRRIAFGRPLAELPLHRETLAELDAEAAGAFLLAFLVVELLGAQEAGELDAEAETLLRFITPIAKLATAKQSVAVISEALEAFGGAGYVEDTGLPVLLRDAQVLPIWEGTTNVLALDALLRTDAADGLAAVRRRVSGFAAAAPDGELARSAEAALAALAHAGRWLASEHDPIRRQAGARRFAFTVARALELGLLAGHGTAMCGEPESMAVHDACRRLRRHGIDSIQDEERG